MELPITWNVLQATRHSAEDCLAKTNWTQLCSRASQLNHNQQCKVLDQTTTGLNHVIRLIEFQDGTHWVVKIPLHDGKYDQSGRGFGLGVEVDVTRLLGERTSAVPIIFDYELTADNLVGVPFILMDFLPGNTAMDSLGGWEVHHGIIPHDHRPDFYRSIANMQVEVASVRFSKIGIVTRNESGYDIGPFPDIGGPFETAHSFFMAWAQHVQFPSRSLDLLTHMCKQGQQNLAQELRESIAQFPQQLIQLLSEHESLTPGPFPVCHNDLMQSNVIVDKAFKVLGIIDWESACTLPWELVDYPLFLDTLPRAFSMPEKYDEKGVPLDIETRECWQDRETYLNRVQEAETSDHRLSESLENWKDLAYVVRAFKGGKLGFYNKVLDAYHRG